MKKDANFISYKTKEWTRDITSLASPLILLFIPFIILGWSAAYKALLLLLLINEVICSLIKYFFHKPRPDQQEYKGALEKIDAGSFPSIHSSRITISFGYLAMYTDQLEVKIALILFAILVLCSRVLLKRHFITDVIGGLVIGMIILYIYSSLNNVVGFTFG